VLLTQESNTSKLVKKCRMGLFKNIPCTVGIVLLLLICIVAILAPWLAPFSPSEMHIGNRLEPPSSAHKLGTDQFGRDLLSRLLFGLRTTILIGVTSLSTAALSGTAIGLIAGYYHNTWVDALVVKVVDIMMTLPTMVMGIMVVAILGPGFSNLLLAIVLALVPRFIKLIRSEAISIRESGFIEASLALGASPKRIILVHMFLNVLSSLLVCVTLWGATAILIETSLTFLGLGVRPPTASLGNIIRQGANYLTTAPWMILSGGAGVTITIYALSLVGESLRDVFDPRIYSS